MSGVRLAVPWYVHPAQAGDQWSLLAAVADRVSFAVVNVHDGPGTSRDPYYPEAVAALTAAGVTLLGYVDSDYGRRPWRRVERDIGQWADRYPVRGVLLDRLPAHGAAWYAHRARKVARCDLVAGNPGTVPAAENLDAFDVTCVFEDDLAAYTQFDPPPWLRAVDPARVWHLVHGVPETLWGPVALRGVQFGAGHLFLTDRIGANPWCGLPTGLIGAIDPVLGG